MTVFEKYNQEIQEDVKVDQLNLLEKQMLLPALKHKWVSRLIDAKRNRNNLEKRKKELREQVFKSLQEKGIPTGIPKSSLNSKIDSSDVILKINEDLDEINLLVEYLDKVENIFRSMTFDFKNITEITKLETT